MPLIKLALDGEGQPQACDVKPADAVPWSIAGALYVSIGGKLVDIVSGALPTADTTTPRPSANGMAAEFDGSSNERVAFASNSRNGPIGALTLIVHFELDAFTNYSPLIAKQSTSITNCPYEFRVGFNATSAEFTSLRANASGYKQYYDAGAPIRFTAGRKNQFAACVYANGDLGTAPTFYVLDGFGIGSFATYSPANSAGSGSGAVTDTSSSVILGNRSDLTTTRLDGGIYSAAVIPVALSAGQVQQAMLEMLRWQHVQGAPIDIWVPSAGGATNATIAGTDGADSAAIVAQTWTTAQIAATDGGDVAALATTITTGAAITGTDGADNAVIAAANWTTAQIAGTDGADVSAITASANNETSASIGATDGGDAASVYAANWTTALLAAVDGADVAALMAGTAGTTSAGISATDAVDIVAIGVAGATGPLILAGSARHAATLTGSARHAATLQGSIAHV